MPAKQPAPIPAESLGDNRTPPRYPRYRRPTAEEIEKWREENAEAIASVNEWVEKNGLPLAKHRVW